LRKRSFPQLEVASGLLTTCRLILMKFYGGRLWK
jgi:hypothetical protein